MPAEGGDPFHLETYSTDVVVSEHADNGIELSTDSCLSKHERNRSPSPDRLSSGYPDKSTAGNGVLDEIVNDSSKRRRDGERKRRSTDREGRSERRGRHRGDSPKEERCWKRSSRSHRSPEKYSSGGDHRTDEGQYRNRERDYDSHGQRERGSRGHSKRSYRSRSRDNETSEREKSGEKSELSKPSTTSGQRKRISKWDSLPETLPDDGHLHLQIKPYEGGFSSAPPPPPVPPPHASADGGQSNETNAGDASTKSETVADSTVFPPLALQNKLLTAAEIELDKKQRRLYIGNLPPGSTQIDVISFFNGALLAVTVGSGSNYGLNENEVPVQKCEVFNLDSRFCFLEFKTLQLTWLCLKLDGKQSLFEEDAYIIIFRKGGKTGELFYVVTLVLRLYATCIAFNGYSLRVGRPHDYVPPPGGDPAYAAVIPGFDSPPSKEAKPATAPPRGEGSDQKIYIQNIPAEMADEQVKDMLEQFGTLRVLNLIKDLNSGKNKGYGFFEYEDPAHTDIAIQALNGFFCGGNVLVVQRASFNGPPAGWLSMHVYATGRYMLIFDVLMNLGLEKKKDVLVTALPSSMTHRILSHALVGLQIEATRKIGEKPTKVVQLLNTVFQEDLLDNAEYNEILEDIKSEASKYGPLEQICIPRPLPDLSFQEGVGKVFLLFSDETAARKARMMMNGRKFDNTRVVCAAFYPEDRFLEGKYSLT
ncbi:U2 snRNP auxilliary factor, large subunit, splicing factor subfamily protein [Cardiosporidium cionae]|uniref:U2 snRNP auxilliary factor, large subunit, splicing factor subfamily protein n=1 Tax=Cardiosporidium cionae TaxID=476202 RepID=A0ABQ7JG14_9APIC|nr:U2 snRNP auxilliary factor, large subunit, splicing factor subfamily protein [Cardiosporidium cionae]|eukprot:KAF8822961.1 U2 snRNP auxilliary factor, large subunit, splicing factor subfamily protein [Cardiosporidium cionae]